MTAEGRIRSEMHGHIFKIIIDNPSKKNAFSPAMMEQLSDALTELHNNSDLWVGAICAEGSDFTAGLDMPKFFGPTAEKRSIKEGNVDPFGLSKRCKKPIVMAVQGIVFTIGIELMLAGDIVVAADDARFCQMESKRGIAPLGGAHFRYLSHAGWAMRCITCSCVTSSRRSAPARSAWFRRSCRQASRSRGPRRSPKPSRPNAPLGIQVTKEAAAKYIEGGEAAAIACIPTIRDRVLNSADAKEGIQSFIEWRAAVFQGR